MNDAEKPNKATPADKIHAQKQILEADVISAVKRFSEATGIPESAVRLSYRAMYIIDCLEAQANIEIYL